ncbi:GNAT family N-acetyltransferase [Aurantimonas sp. 22II-16-19i]|uniref:GNAT family N-acetyltransferase n=1 Tax=Aurantimonas sp. 22II-16-19i TaxID=1317114 RepID=UPI0009F9E2CA|nr:GNAT family N-acetyltransferase [Aurantimonas sp. 22II-16-19i]
MTASSAWRAMRPADLAAVLALADRIHPDLPEDPPIFAERLALCPEGCFVLEAGGLDSGRPDAGEDVAGYTLAHPIRHLGPPPLNTLIGAIAPDADAFYIHDVAIAPHMRGQGLAEPVVTALLDVARGFPRACLVSVYGTVPFWERFGFVDASDALPRGKLAGYGADARFMLRPSRVQMTAD